MASLTAAEYDAMSVEQKKEVYEAFEAKLHEYIRKVNDVFFGGDGSTGHDTFPFVNVVRTFMADKLRDAGDVAKLMHTIGADALAAKIVADAMDVNVTTAFLVGLLMGQDEYELERWECGDHNHGH